MLDHLPAWLRHLIIVFGGAAGAIVVREIVDDGGVTHVPWAATARTALDTGSIAAAVAAAALWGLPITRAYGVGKTGRHAA